MVQFAPQQDQSRPQLAYLVGPVACASGCLRLLAVGPAAGVLLLGSALTGGFCLRSCRSLAGGLPADCVAASSRGCARCCGSLLAGCTFRFFLFRSSSGVRPLPRVPPALPFLLSVALPSAAAAGSPAARFLFAVVAGCADAGEGLARCSSTGLPPAYAALRGYELHKCGGMKR